MRSDQLTGCSRGCRAGRSAPVLFEQAADLVGGGDRGLEEDIAASDGEVHAGLRHLHVLCATRERSAARPTFSRPTNPTTAEPPEVHVCRCAGCGPMVRYGTTLYGSEWSSKKVSPCTAAEHRECPRTQGQTCGRRAARLCALCARCVHHTQHTTNRTHTSTRAQSELMGGHAPGS